MAGRVSLRTALGWLVPMALLACVLLVFTGAGGDTPGGVATAEPAREIPALPWYVVLSPSVLITSACLLVLSAFFSASETAFFSIQRHRLRTLRGDKRYIPQLVVRMLDHPGHLLTTILVGNMLVNTVIGVVLGTRVKNLFEETFQWPSPVAYPVAVISCAAVLLFFGEITPKVFAVRTGEAFSRIAALPLLVTGRLLAPLRNGLQRLTEFLFRVSHFNELRAAPYITDEELKSVLSNGDSKDMVEEEGRQMIRRILEFHDVMLREVLVPRPDVIALPETATVAEARDLFRQNEFSRMPVYADDLDHIQGVLFAKDLLPSLSKGELDRPVKAFARPAHYVPETMSVHDFVRDAQRQRTHLAIVVDEYGGTEGIVTLEDAIEQVVGDIPDEDEEEDLGYEKLAEGVYRIQGNLPLDELSELTGVDIEDEEHETVAGFLMGRFDKVLVKNDQIDFGNLRFTVEAVADKRVDSVRVEILRDRKETPTS